MLRFHRLSFAAEGDEVVVGRRDIDSYGVFPPDGAALVRELEAGRSLPDAARWYEATYGEAVDVDAFVATLADLEFLRDDDEPLAEERPPVGWQRLGRALFCPPAMAVYLAVVAVAVLFAISDPSLVAAFRATSSSSSSFVVVELTIVLGQLPLSGIHELAHLLAGRRLGLNSRIRLSNRFYFVVFETTLDGLVGVPRRQRYLPMLAGMGADVVVMAALTIAAGAGAATARSPAASASPSPSARCPGSCGSATSSCRPTSTTCVSTVLGCIDLHATSRQWLANRLNRVVGPTRARSSTRPRGIPTTVGPPAGTDR